MTARPDVRDRPTLILNLAGVTAAQVANALDVTRQAISYHLRGQGAATPPELLEAITELAGPNVAAEVRRAIELARRGGADPASDPTFDPDHVTPGGSP